jgi:hypothetical protein
MPGMTYEEKLVYLSPGESVLLHSDGLVEVHDPSGEMFGFGRPQEIVENSSGAESLIQESLAALRKFVGSDWEQEDDITLVALERTPSRSATVSCPVSHYYRRQPDGRRMEMLPEDKNVITGGASSTSPVRRCPASDLLP